MTEIPHKWFFNDRECEMVGPIVDRVKLQVIALEIKQDGNTFIVCDHDGEFPGVTYELIN